VNEGSNPFLVRKTCSEMVAISACKVGRRCFFAGIAEKS